MHSFCVFSLLHSNRSLEQRYYFRNSMKRGSQYLDFLCCESNKYAFLKCTFRSISNLYVIDRAILGGVPVFTIAHQLVYNCCASGYTFSLSGKKGSLNVPSQQYLCMHVFGFHFVYITKGCRCPAHIPAVRYYGSLTAAN